MRSRLQPRRSPVNRDVRKRLRISGLMAGFSNEDLTVITYLIYSYRKFSNLMEPSFVVESITIKWETAKELQI